MEKEVANAIFEKLKKENKGLNFNDSIGEGGYGEVREVSYKKKDENGKEKLYKGAGKLIKREEVDETKYLSEFGGPRNS